MGLYSKTKDYVLKKQKETYISGGVKVLKNAASVHFLGTADELNSHLGLVKAILQDEDQKQFIEGIQKNIMKLMSHVSDITNENYFLTDDDVNILEDETGRLNAKLPEQSQFVLPGRNAVEAQIHIARTVARRAERHFSAIDERRLCPQAGSYLDKLSSYLFVLSHI
jgi:cob(I)alamin adenosyltransferase